MYITVGFCFIRGNFSDHFVRGKSNRNWQSCFVDDLLPEINSPLIGIEKPVHPGKIEIKFIDRSLLKQGSPGGDDLSNPAGIPAVIIPAATYDNCVRT